MSIASERRAAVERAFPGVVCKRVTYTCHPFEPDNDHGRHFPGHRLFRLSCCVVGSAEVLIAHGLVTQKDIDSLPPSGKSYSLRRLNGAFQASLWWHENWQEPTVARDMATKIGITLVEKSVKRCLRIGNRVARWTSVGNLISVDWLDIQRHVKLAAMSQ